MKKSTFDRLNKKIVSCKKCPRLIRYCKKIAVDKKKAFQNESYWGKPIPGFGDPLASIIIVGLAPAAHGGNRTGRMFTGDQSGLWLYRALFKKKLSNQINSTHASDALKLHNVYITAAARCAPPENKPTPKEFQNCSDYLEEEWDLLKNKKVFITLGKIAFDSLWKLILKKEGLIDATIHKKLKKPPFQHGLNFKYFSPSQQKDLTLLLSFHPSQQNTFTKKLTEEMFDSIFSEALFQN